MSSMMTDDAMTFIEYTSIHAYMHAVHHTPVRLRSVPVLIFGTTVSCKNGCIQCVSGMLAGAMHKTERFAVTVQYSSASVYQYFCTPISSRIVNNSTK